MSREGSLLHSQSTAEGQRVRYRRAKSHWSVESMHWVLDVVFHDDARRIRTKNATANFTFTKCYVTTLLKRDTAKHSLKR